MGRFRLSPRWVTVPFSPSTEAPRASSDVEVRPTRWWRALVVLVLGSHIGAVGYLFAVRWTGGIGWEWLSRFLTACFVTGILYHAAERLVERPTSARRRFMFYAFLIFAARDYVVPFSPHLADLMSLTTVWCILRSQVPALSPSALLRKLAGRVYGTGLFLLVCWDLLIAVEARGNIGLLSDWPKTTAYSVVFATSHFTLIGLIVALYARAATRSLDPLLRTRLAGLLSAGGLYILLFSCDLLIRLGNGGSGEAGGPVVQAIKHGIENIALLCFYLALNMGPRLSGFILRHHQRRSLAEAHRSVVSLAVYLSETIAERSSHILPVYAVAVGERLGLSPPELGHLREAAAVVALVYRHQLPGWESDGACERAAAAAEAPPLLPRAYQERLQALVVIEKIVREQALPYYATTERTLPAASIIRAVRDYLVYGSLEPLQEGAGSEYAPDVVAALRALLLEWAGNDHLAPREADA